MLSAKEFINHMSQFRNGRRCRLRKIDAEEAVNKALSEVIDNIPDGMQIHIKAELTRRIRNMMIMGDCNER